ncbi:MAG: HD domain-containing protein [Pyrobaculum sp.]
MSSCQAGPGEPLGDHLLGVADCVSKRGVPVAKKLARVFKIGEGEALDLITFAALAHDAGKADVSYEKAIDRFPLHEVKSTAFVKRVFQELRIIDNCDLGRGEDSLAKAVVAAVALHHYVHKEPNKATVADGLTPRCLDVAEAFKQWRPRTPLGEALKSKALEIAAGNVGPNTCYRDVVNTLHSVSTRLRYAVMAILGVLNRCDYEVAKARRAAEHPGTPADILARPRV